MPTYHATSITATRALAVCRKREESVAWSIIYPTSRKSSALYKELTHSETGTIVVLL